MIRSFSRLAVYALLAAVFSGVYADSCEAQSFQYPPYGAWRGRMVARDGIGHSVRYRWGNGLTATGGAVLGQAIDAFAPVALAFAGRGEEDDSQARGDGSTIDRQALANAQNDANALLARTARLIDPTFQYNATVSQTPTGQGGSGGGIAPSQVPNYGPNPWPGFTNTD
jgi:hypothetical protein